MKISWTSLKRPLLGAALILFAPSLFVITTHQLAAANKAIKDSNRANPEIGSVSWIRDFDAGLKQAATSKKPVFLLFQEVPG